MAEGGWTTWLEALDSARAELIAAAPSGTTAAEVESFVARAAAAGLRDALLADSLTEGGLTRTLPVMGAPNPDYRMWHSAIDPERCYRLEGRINGSERVGIGLYAFGLDGTALLRGYAAFDLGNVGSDGSFALNLAADASAPSGLAIAPDCRAMMLRVLHRDESAPACATLRGGPSAVWLGADSCDAAIGQAGMRLLRSVRQFLRWSRLASEAPNQIAPPPSLIAKEVQGDPDTIYGIGYFELAPDECLEVELPRGLAGYWSLWAYTHWLELLPGAGVHDRNAVPDPDGRIRIRIGPAPPDLPNAVNTHGRRRGVLIYRSIGGDLAAPHEARLRQGSG